MTALAAPRNTISKEERLLYLPMAADAVIYNGSIVCRDADGYAVAGADTAGYIAAGVCTDDPLQPGISTFSNVGGSDGDNWVLVRRKGRYRFNIHETPQQDMLFANVYVYDDQTVAVGVWNVTNDVRCGHITALPGTYLAIEPHAEFDTDEVEIEFSGEPWDWNGGTTTAAPTTTTTTQGA